MHAQPAPPAPSPKQDEALANPPMTVEEAARFFEGNPKGIGYDFTIMTRMPTQDEIITKTNTLLLIKEAGKPWQLYFATSEGGNTGNIVGKLEPKNIPDALIQHLNSENLSLKEIKSYFNKMQGNVSALKALKETVDTERTFYRGIQEFIRRVDQIFPDLEAEDQRKLDAFLTPYRAFQDLFANFNVDENLSIGEQTAAYEKKIKEILNAPIFVNNLEVFLKVVPTYTKFRKFLSDERKINKQIADLEKNKSIDEMDSAIQNMSVSSASVSGSSVAKEGSMSLGTLHILPVQRWPRYQILLEALNKVMPGEFSAEYTSVYNKGQELNRATSRESDVVKQLHARKAVGEISKRIRILLEKGVSTDPAIFEDFLVQLEWLRNVNPKEDPIRQKLEYDLLQLYMKTYLIGRYKGALTTSKKDYLKALEKFIFNLNHQLSEIGVKPLLVDKAEDLDVKGKDNREEVIFARVADLPEAEFKKFIRELYAQAKSEIQNIKGVTTPAQMEEVKTHYANAFKVLERVGTKGNNNAKLLWQEIVLADNDVMRKFFLLDEKNPSQEIKESKVKEIFQKNINNLQQVLSISPELAAAIAELQKAEEEVVSPQLPSAAAAGAADKPKEQEEESKEDESKEDVEDRYAVAQPAAAQSAVASNMGVANTNAFKREIFGVIAEQVLEAIKEGNLLGYDQAVILANLAEEINKRFFSTPQILREFADLEGKLAYWEALARQEGRARPELDDVKRTHDDLKRRIIPDEMSYAELPQIFYGNFVAAYADAFMLKSKGKNALLVLQDLAVGLDEILQKYTKKLPGYAPVSGIVFQDKKPTTSEIDDVILAGSRLTAEQRQLLVDHLFERANYFVTHDPRGSYEQQAFKNAIRAVLKMGMPAIEWWNARAEREFYELRITPDAAHLLESNQKLRRSFNYLVQLKPEENQRRAALVDLVTNTFNEAMKGVSLNSFPEQARVAALHTLMATNSNAVVDRPTLIKNLQHALFDIHMRAYLHGRIKVSGKSTADDYLNAVETFIKMVDTRLTAAGQAPLIADVSRYKTNAIENAELVFHQFEEIVGKPIVVENKQSISDFLKQKVFSQGVNAEQVSLFEKDNMGKLSIVTDQQKIETLTQNIATHSEHVSDILKQAGVARVIVSRNDIVAIVDANRLTLVEKGLYERVSNLFLTVKTAFDKMKEDFLNQGAFELYATKDIENSFYSARKILVNAMKAIERLESPVTKQIWNQLATEHARGYGGFNSLFIIDMEKEISEKPIKKGFEQELEMMKKVHHLFVKLQKDGLENMLKAVDSDSAVESYANNAKDKKNPFRIARLALVETVKAVQDVAKSTPSAIIYWNYLVKEMGSQYGQFQEALKIPREGEWKEDQIKSVFKNKVETLLGILKAGSKPSQHVFFKPALVSSSGSAPAASASARPAVAPEEEQKKQGAAPTLTSRSTGS
jgi:hypothetical protein